MFLPVLLVRDYGIWGFVVFAVPNVVGAGAMGWVLKSSQRAIEITQRHRAACLLFSLVTISFHAFFAAWLLGSQIPSTGPLPWAAIVALGIVIAGVAALTALAAKPIPWLASPVVVWCVSAALAAAFLVVNSATFQGMGAPTFVGIGSPTRSLSDLALLAPVCIFGFALCPYLDLTFLRTRELAADGSPAAFTLGFGVLFLAMILFTLSYAATVLGYSRMAVFAIANFIVVLQFVVQGIFTVGVHSAAIAQGPARSPRWAGMALLAAIGAGLLVGVLSARFQQPDPLRASPQMALGEIAYRCFMSFYGLVFPAYVWLCMIPTRDGHSGIDGERGRRKLVVLGVACALAAPCYWMGFIERVEWWLAVGLGVVLLARLCVRTSPARVS